MVINGWRLSRLFVRVSTNFKFDLQKWFPPCLIRESRRRSRERTSIPSNSDSKQRLRSQVYRFLFPGLELLSSSFPPPSPTRFIFPGSTPDVRKKHKAIKSIKFWEKKVFNWIMTSNGVMDHGSPRVKRRKLFKPWNAKFHIKPNESRSNNFSE